MQKWFLFTLALIFVMTLSMTLNCSDEEKEDPPGNDDSVVIEFEVSHDDVFGFSPGDVVSKIWFSDTQGPVGAPLDIEVTLIEPASFNSETLHIEMVLENTAATKVDEYEVEYDFSSETGEFMMVIPQVYTVPTILNFDVTMSYYEEGTENYFEAYTLFQFKVAEGAPAT